MRSKMIEDDEEAKVKLEDDKMEEAKGKVMELPMTLLATQTISQADDNILTRTIKVIGLAVMAVITFLQSS